MSDTTPCFVGRKSCGCIVAFMVDDRKRPTEVAKKVAEWVRSGLAIERMTVEESRPLFKMCPHTDVAKQMTLEATS